MQARVKYVFELLTRTDRPVLVLLDNAEQILNEQGDVSPTWRHFLTQFVQTDHRACFVLATQQWPWSFLSETQLISSSLVPPLSRAEGSALLQRLGLRSVPEERLNQIVDAVGGIPLCLEWVARLVQEPLFHDEWVDFDEDAPGEIIVQGILEDTALFAGPIASRVQPLLERVIKHLSPAARTALFELAVSPVALGSPALKSLYRNPEPLKELREASLLVAYPTRVYLLPMVAVQVRKSLSENQIHAAEERLIQALSVWLNKGIVDTHEQGVVFTELACLLLRRHRFLAAAELVLYHGWLSSHVGLMVKLARFARQMSEERAREDVFHTESDAETESGSSLLRFYLASYPGEDITQRERAESYRHLLALVFGV